MSVLASKWFDEPVSERFRLRRSTALLAVVFVGLGVLFVHTREDPDPDLPERVLIMPTNSVSSEPTITEDS